MARAAQGSHRKDAQTRKKDGVLRPPQAAHAALQLGLLEQADALVVEADALAPGWGIVPDRWGLWPPDQLAALSALEASTAPQRQHCLQLVDDYLLLRHLPAVEIWRSWLAPVQQSWQRAAEPQQLGLMGLLLGRAEQLPAPLEPALEQLVGEEQVTADPSAALAVWAPLSRAGRMDLRPPKSSRPEPATAASQGL